MIRTLGGAYGTGAGGVGGSAEPLQWLYKDPQGKEQGPYPASQLLAWTEQGYFPISLQARAPPSAESATPLLLVPVHYHPYALRSSPVRLPAVAVTWGSRC